MFNQQDKLTEILQSDRLELTLSLNIIINAAKANWDSLSKLDQYLLGRALETLQSYSDKKEDIVIKLSK